MLEITITQECVDALKKLPIHVRRKAEKQIKLFSANPFHPSLNTEKLTPKQREHWSIRIDQKYRIIFRFIDNRRVALLTAGSHDFVYRYRF